MEAIRLIEARQVFTSAEREGLRDWFRQYARWLTTSKIGLAENNSGNNPANWWPAQGKRSTIPSLAKVLNVR